MQYRVYRATGPGIFVMLTVLVLSACATRNAGFAKVDALVEQRDYRNAAAELQGSRLYSPKDLVVQALDQGILQLYAGDDVAGIASLSRAEDLIAEYFTKSVSSAVGSFLINDAELEYPGEDYEDLYLNVFKALAYARDRQSDGAFVEIKRLNDKLNFLEDKYRKLADELDEQKGAAGLMKPGRQEFANSALARWLSMVMYRADGDLDNAALDLKGIKAAFKDQAAIYGFPVPALDKALRPKTDYLDIVAFSGRSPIKKAVTYRVVLKNSTLAITRELEDRQGTMRLENAGVLHVPGLEGDVFFKCQVPTMEVRESPVRSVEVYIDGNRAGALSLIERMDKVAVSTFKQREPLIYVKTLLRSTLKTIAASKGKDALSEKIDNPLLGKLLRGGADAAVELTEMADLRSARFFPGSAWVGSFELSPGTHAVELRYLDAKGQVLYVDSPAPAEVRAKDLNLLGSTSLDGLR